MLHLYQSNRLEILLELLSAVISEPLSNPFAKETVIVQSKGMGRWISLRLAEKQGICANIDFPLPASYLWDLLCKNLGDLPKRSGFSPEIMTWRILERLETADTLDARLQSYLKDGSDIRRFELAQRIAQTFDQYLVYRPDWIQAFESARTLDLGPDEAWQASLWRELAANPEPHRAQLIDSLLKNIDSRNASCGERIVLFGISSLPPVFLEVIKALSQVMEVCLFVLNPCQNPWGDIKDHQEIARLTKQSHADELYLYTGNPLLASLGKQGREFFDQLIAENLESHELFQDEPPQTLLQLIQSDLLNLIDRNIDKDKPDFKDNSIQIHVCHSAMREIEVLRDQLLLLLNADDTLQASDIAVLTPDIHAMAPFIEAVFASDTHPKIPFSIADLAETEQQPLIERFLQLLELPNARFQASWVLDFLQLPALLKRFSLDESDLPLIHDWVRNTRIRWGQDSAHRASLNLPDESLNSWRDGLQRLLLGYALPKSICADGMPLFSSILPYDDMEGGLAQTLGHFSEFVETLMRFSQSLAIKRTLPDWAALMNELLEAFFQAYDETDEDTLQKLRDAFEELIASAELSQFELETDLSVIARWLKKQLQQPGSGGFLTGGVTFCAMVPMRCIPFKVIGLIGMNDGVFPRQMRPVSFDLIAQNPRMGDRSRRLDDRYLFLETLLSVREKLYISYVGKNIRDNMALPPSVLVSDLIDLIKATGPENCLDSIVNEHFLQAFNPGYFQGQIKYPGFSSNWLEAARLLDQEKHPAPALFTEALPEPGEEWRGLSLEDLDYFYANPARYVLKNRISLILPQEEEPIADREPFELGYFDKSLIRESMLAQIQTGQKAEDAWQLMRAEGLLPHGSFGQALFKAEQNIAESFSASLLPFLTETMLAPLPFCFESRDHNLTGALKGVRPHGLIAWTAQKLSARNLFSLWLKHLCLCCLKPEGVKLQSRLISIDQIVLLNEVETPEMHLAKLLDYYREGLSYPLPFFVKSAFGYTNAKEDGLKAAHKVWDATGIENSFGESENIWYQAVYKGIDPLDARFAQIALDLFNPVLEAMNS